MSMKISEGIGIHRGVLDADITTDRTGAYYDVSGARRITGKLFTSTVADTKVATIELLQATASDGTGSKSLKGPVTATSNGGEVLEVMVEATSNELDMANGYRYVAVKVTSDNATAVVGTAVLLLGSRRFNS